MAHIVIVGAGLGGLPTAYELRHILPRQHQITVISESPHFTFIPSLPWVALGLTSLDSIQMSLEHRLKQRRINWIHGRVDKLNPHSLENAAVTAIEPNQIHLGNGRVLPFAYSMLLPPFRGPRFVRQVPGLSNPDGFIPVLPTYRHPEYPSIYAVGVVVQIKPPEETPLPLGVPKTGQMTEAMGMAVAHNIAIELGVISAQPVTPTLDAICFADFGNTGILFLANPVLPDLITGKRRRAVALSGTWVSWAKTAFEKYFLAKMRFGAAVPWFERIGLKFLGLSLVEPIPVQSSRNISQKIT